MILKFSFFRNSLLCLNKESLRLQLLSAQVTNNRISIVTHRKDFGAMASNNEVERLKEQAEKAESMIASLEEQINCVRKAAVKQAGLGEEEKLKKENEQLKQEIQTINTSLVMAEINNGVRQVFVPSKAAAAAATTLSNVEAATKSQSPSESGPTSSTTDAKGKKENASQKKADAGAGDKKAKAEPKAKKEDGNKGKKTAGDANATVDISRLDMRVGKIVAVEKHPKADTLYVEQVDLGEGKNRTIISGLVDHVPINAMRDRIAVFMCNLKPVKMREIFSQGMIMCASSEEKTEILVPPPDAEIGDHVTFEDYPGVPDEQLNPKKKIWETLKPSIRTNKDRVATYKGSAFTIKGKGVVVAPTLADAQIS